MATGPVSIDKSGQLASDTGDNLFRFCLKQRRSMSMLGLCAFILVTLSGIAEAQTAPGLGAADPFGVAAGALTNTGPTVITGNLCASSLAGPPPTFSSPPALAACSGPVVAAENAALTNLTGQACTNHGAGAVDLGNTTVVPGCNSYGGAINIAAGPVTLNGNGVYIFITSGALNQTAGTTFILLNNASPANVFWAPGGGTTLAGISFVGNVISANGITVGANTNLQGRLLGINGPVTMNTSTVAVPAPAGPGPGPAVAPALSVWAMMALVTLIMFTGLAVLRRQAG